MGKHQMTQHTFERGPRKRQARKGTESLIKGKMSEASGKKDI